MSFEKLANNDSRIESLNISAGKAEFHKMAVSQFNCESKDVPQEIDSLIICSAWDDHVIMEVIAKEFLEETV